MRAPVLIRIFAKTALLSLFFFPATLLHELSHALTALLCGGRVIRFDFLPDIRKREDNNYDVVFGEVESEASWRGAFLLIGLAPALYGGVYCYGYY